MSDLAAQWHEMGFIHEGTAVKLAFRAQPAASPALEGWIESAQRDFLQTHPGQSLGMSVMTLAGSSKAGSANELLDTLGSAIGSDPDSMEDDEREQWQQLVLAAEQLSEGSPAQDAMDVDFVWNNGGGDDNLFSDGFWFHPSQHDLAQEWVLQLGQWGEDHDHWYDFRAALARDAANPTDGRMDIPEFQQWMEEQYSGGTPLAPSLRTLCENVMGLDAQAHLDSTLPHQTPHRQAPRL